MDWKTLIAEIQRHGEMTQPQIAAVVGCGQATISDLSLGNTKEPRHSLGEALKQLHAKVVEQSRLKATEPTPAGA